MPKTIATLRPRIRSEVLSAVVAAYLLFGLNATFWQKSLAYLDGQYPALAALALGLLSGFIALCVAFSTKYLIKPFLILLILSSATASWSMDRFGVIIDREMIRNGVETNSAEVSHLITPGLIFYLLFFGVLPSLLVIWVRVRHRPILNKVGINLLVIVPCVMALGGSALVGSRPFLFNSRQHQDWFRTLNPIFPVASAIDFALRATAERNIVLQPLGTDARVTDALPSAERRPRATVLIVGETARAQNFQLDGYQRPTNPELSKRDVTYFKDTSSCGTATAVSVPCMFSVYGRADYTHSKALATETLMDVLSHAGIKVEWWDNNTGDKNVAARIARKELFKSQDPRFCKDGECLDDILLADLDHWLDALQSDAVLVLHQLGNHGPAYYLRYPESYRKFLPDCRTVEFRDCSNEMIVNAYDNALLYTDHIIASVIDKLEARQDRLDSAVIYMSDHGESLGESGLYLHGAPYMVAPEVQTRIPFVFWTNGHFENPLGLNKTCLAETAGLPRSHDNLFHTVLGMMNVSTDVYDPQLDILAGCRGTS